MKKLNLRCIIVCVVLLSIGAVFAASSNSLRNHERRTVSTTLSAAPEFNGTIQSVDTKEGGLKETIITVSGHEPPASTMTVRESTGSRGKNSGWGKRKNSTKTTSKGGSGTEVRKFNVDNLCHIQVAGKSSGSVNDLAVGQHISITYTSSGDGPLIANNIESAPAGNESSKAKAKNKMKKVPKK